MRCRDRFPTGTATFNLMAATSPTLDIGWNPPGSLNSAGQVGGSWGGAANPLHGGLAYNLATCSFGGVITQVGIRHNRRRVVLIQLQVE